MKKLEAKHILIPALIMAAIVVVYYLLKGNGTPTQVSYPNANASGLPAYQSGGVAYNMGSPQAGPSPNLIYQPAPALPPTPAYQRVNYSPLNIFALTPDAALSAAGAPSPTGEGGCGCGCDGNTAKFLDGSQLVGVVANPSEQVGGGLSSLYNAVAANLATSVLSDQNLAWAQIAQTMAAVPNQSF